MGRTEIGINIGERFGRLTVIAPAERNKENRVQFLCKCECGNETVALAKHLKNGNTKSCGCFKRDQGLKANVTHGLSKTNLYKKWANIKDRCDRKNNKSFHNYGGRGITICDEWKNSFQAFYDYVSKLPHFGEKGYSLDRINNDGNYEPGNVRWATRKEQNSNKRCTRTVEFNGETHTLKEWAKITGLNYYTLHKRYRAGKKPDEILKPYKKGGDL